MSDFVVAFVYLVLVYVATREDLPMKSEDLRCPLCGGPLQPSTHADVFCECIPCGLTTWCSEDSKAEGIKEGMDKNAE